MHLPPKELAVLRFLLEADGVLVSKDSLLENVWPGCDVAEESLTRCIYALRKMLGENKSYIGTVYGKGYRFTAPVIKLKAPEAQSQGPSFLVLPFRSDTAFMGAQVHEDITRRLTNAFAGVLRIMPASLTAGQSCVGDTLQMVERLAPDYYLSGRCTSVGDHIELSIELARSRDHVLLHSQVIEGEGIVAAVEAVVVMVAQRLPGVRPKSESCSSYPLALSYLNGLTGLQEYTPQSLCEALQQFHRCVRLDEGYAPPWCGLAEVWLALAALGLCSEDYAFEQAQRALGKALALEPGNHAALLRLALLTSLQGSTDAAEALFQRLLSGGNHADAYYCYTWHQWFCGREASAAHSIDVCLSHDPDSVAAQILKMRILAHREPKVALALIRQSLAANLAEHPVVLGLATMVFASVDDAGCTQAMGLRETGLFDAGAYWRLSSPGRLSGKCLAQVAVSTVSWGAPKFSGLILSGNAAQEMFNAPEKSRVAITVADGGPHRLGSWPGL